LNAYSIIEETVREAYGRLISFLTVNWRDVEAIEDALADALLAALETWPKAGVPDKPESWLLAVAKRKLIDRARRSRVSERALPSLLAVSAEIQQIVSSDRTFPDERLNMMFLCSHPSIDPSIRTALMLQIVLGIDASRIASAFVIKPSTMGQHLTRAKAKIRSERLTFEMPDAEQLPNRLDAVLEAIYACYGSGWDDLTGVDPRRKGLVQEAVYLGKLPLSKQDTRRWSTPLIIEAEQRLTLASQAKRIGRFQLLAAIQFVHAQRASTGRTEWNEIALLYEGLARLSPTIGILVGRAAAVAEGYGTERGLALLELIPRERIVSYQPYWALKAHLHASMGKHEEAHAAYSCAIGLCEDPSVRQFLIQQTKLI
jgi:predicted RNA polymerase sigma factor